MSDIPIIRLGGYLLVPIQSELHDKAALELQGEILRNIEMHAPKGLLLDVSGVSIVDSFLARLMGDTSRMARLMGVETVLVGMKKEVVITLLQLGMVLTGIHTALNIEDGMEILEGVVREAAAAPEDSP